MITIEVDLSEMIEMQERTNYYLQQMQEAFELSINLLRYEMVMLQEAQINTGSALYIWSLALLAFQAGLTLMVIFAIIWSKTV